MKILFIFFAAVLSGTLPLLPQGVSSDTVQIIPFESNGQEAIRLIRISYEEGEYDAFLAESDKTYREVKENGEFSQFAIGRFNSDFKWSDWDKRANALLDEKREALLEAIENQENSPFVNKVHSLALDLPDEEKREALSKISSFRFMAPGTGKTQDENTLIDLDLEYEYKALHLYHPEPSSEERREKLAALKMEHLEKMNAALAHFEDAELKKTVDLFSNGFDERLGTSWDSLDLSELINGKRKPANAIEEKVSQVLEHYLDKFKDLGNEFMSENEKS